MVSRFNCQQLYNLHKGEGNNRKKKNMSTNRSMLRGERTRQGMTMTALALSARVTCCSLSLYERGQRPSQPVARRLAGVLQCAPEKLWPDYGEFRQW